MVNPLENEEMRALEAIVTLRTFPGIMAGLAGMCARWKSSVADDAARDVLVILETYFEASGNETKLILMGQRTVADVCAAFAHHKEFSVILSAGLDPPDVKPEVQ